jgi:solute carrier family 32 (vesicular inhibitory amino acid transporter)
MRLNSIRQMGGPNSIDNFTRSFQRAAGFREITPIRRGSISVAGDGDEEDVAEEEEDTPRASKSLLRQQIDAEGIPPASESAIQEDEDDMSREDRRLLPVASQQTIRSLGPPHLMGHGFSSYGGSYGTISPRITESARRRASILIQQQFEASLRAGVAPDDDKVGEERIIEREEGEDGEVIERQVGESTVPMTIFNSTNVLIGVGILALPLGLKYAGWIIGLLSLSLAALVTSYTAKLLAKCLDTNSASTTYGDIAFLAFDVWGRNLVESLFVLELTAANVALVILFADSVNSLIPALSIFECKAIVVFGLIPLNFVPFKTLSISSIIGIFSCLGILLIVVIDGFIKPHAPGSLREVATTYAFPADWRTIPLSIGLFMAPWGGHSVFPAVYKDMRHPKKYNTALKYTYVFTYGLDVSMAAIGYLMFGESVHDEVTSNILKLTSYPHVLSVIIVCLIAIIPITKIPLSNRPMMDTINKKLYIDLRQMDPKSRMRSEASIKHRAGRVAVGVACNLVQLGVAILFPDFDSIMALMGSALCFTICVVLPVAFHLKIFGAKGNEIALPEKILNWFLLVFCGLLAVIGTIWAILPKETIGIRGV